MSASRPITQHYHQGTHAGCDTTTLPQRIRNGSILCGVCNGLIAANNTTIMQQLEAVGTHLRNRITAEGEANAEGERTSDPGSPNTIGRRLDHSKVIELKSRQ